MNEYVRLEEVTKIIEEQIRKRYCLEMGNTDRTVLNVLQVVKTRIWKLDIVEAEPVRHGRWYRHPTDENYFCCSVCDGANGLWNQFADCTYEFCPWCGAKMDGGAEDG